MIRLTQATLAAVLATAAVAAEATGPEASPPPGQVAAAAEALAASGRHAEAREMVRRARAIHPADPALAAAWAKLDPAAGADPAPGDPEAAAIAQARADAAMAERAEAAGRRGEAVSLLSAAEARLRLADRSGAARAAAEAIATRRRELLDAADRGDAGAAERARAQAVADAVRRRDQQLGQDGISLETRIARLLELRQRGMVELALARCRQLRDAHPADRRLDDLFAELFEAVHAQRQRDLAERQRILRQELAERIELALLPGGFDGRPRYPEGWLSRRPDRALVVLDTPAWRERLEAVLGNRVTVDFANVDGVQVLRTLADQGAINLVIDPTVQAAGEKLVNLKAAGMTLGNAIGWVATQMGTAWTLSDGAVFVGGSAAEPPVMHMHDAAAAIFSAKDFPQTRDAGFGGGGGGGSGAGGFSLFAGNAAGPAGGTGGRTVEELVDSLKRSVSPQIWSDAANSITVRGTTLIVMAPPPVQQLVAQFIRAQEQANNLQVRVQLRFLALTDTAIEEIGVRWSNLAPSLLATPTANGIYRAANTSSWAGYSANNLPQPGFTISPPTAETGLTLQARMLRNADLSAILTAVERTGRGSVLGQSEIVTLNGVRASAFFGTQFSYIADYDIVGNNLDARIEILTTGTGIDIKPYVSADRRSIALDIQPTVIDASVEQQILMAPRVIPGAGEDGDLIAGNRAYPLDAVNRRVRSAGTSLRNVPDRGSVLIAGLGEHQEVSSAARIPFLGSIPFLGRAFGQRGRYQQRTQYYMIATATIIDYANLEAQL